MVVLPPDAGDSANDSDIEDVPEELQNEVPFEAAGEFQLEEIASENEDDIHVEVKETVKPGQKRKRTSKSAQPDLKRKRSCKSGWKKSAKFRSDIAFEARPEMHELFPMFKGLQPLDIWQLLFDNETVENLLEQTKLYAM